ncbi:hypothetical protein GCM10010201_34930 [Pilimelia columellifera subsp. columellifera]|uniref:Uncharacterized protein n=2 Tax=Pilimelia TaxID=53370 RepID=A0ABN3NTY5_9ACTN
MTLRTAPPAEVEDANGPALIQKSPSRTSSWCGKIAAMTSSPYWLSRYRAGHREQVWHELRQLGRTIRREPYLAQEAEQVCDEMARRARQNVEVIVERLTAAGYRFHTNDDVQAPAMPHAAPTSAASEHVDWLQERFGEVPMTVRSWIRFVGDVWLVGTHPDWAESTSGDPLVIELEGSRLADGPSTRGFFEDEWEAWRGYSARDADLFVLPVAPDRFHKENVSGGSPYGIVLPDGCVDGLFVAETTTLFVSYLNQVFQHGGFPWTSGSENERHIKRDLAAGLLRL